MTMRKIVAVLGSILFMFVAFGSDSDSSSDDVHGSSSGSAESATKSAKNVRDSYTPSQRNAIRSAENYLQMSGFSKAGLIKQLSSSYGDDFSQEDAVFAVENIEVDWNHQAYRAAKNYLDMKGFSRKGLIRQLTSDHGDGFTREEAEYAADKVGL